MLNGGPVAGPVKPGGPAVGAEPMPLWPCCQDPCREVEDCEVFNDRTLLGVDDNSRDGMLELELCVIGDVG